MKLLAVLLTSAISTATINAHAQADTVNIHVVPTYTAPLEAEFFNGEYTKTVIDETPSQTVSAHLDSILNLKSTKVINEGNGIVNVNIKVADSNILFDSSINRTQFSVTTKATVECSNHKGEKSISSKTFTMNINPTRANTISINPRDAQLIWRNGSVAIANQIANNKTFSKLLSNCGVSVFTQTESSNLHHLVQMIAR
ncbi:hypothetical protein [Vibrio owensii]|uniref:hypothetical protein n=1 Tax=Vibrio owensii TaxID=696485 RepID=UPI0018F1A7E4|nr:hypothetical protein [Vibrio owensii]